MSKVTIKQLREHLSQLDKDELMQEMELLYNKFKPVREYYQGELGDESNPLLEQYKKRIREAYFPKQGKGRRKNSQVRKLITDFKKVMVYDLDLIDLQLHRVECAIEYANNHPVKLERYYAPVLTSLEEAIDLLIDRGTLPPFDQRLKWIKEKAPESYRFSEKCRVLLSRVKAA